MDSSFIIGSFVNTLHFGDDEKKWLHPFLIINISNNNVYGIQCSSVKKGNNHSYFSRENIKYFEFQFSNLPYKTHARLDQFEIIEVENIIEFLVISDSKEFKSVCEILLNSTWENNSFLNDAETKNHIKKGKNSHGLIWSCV